MVEPDKIRINLAWLLRLRWGAISGQVVTILLCHHLMHIPLPLGPLFMIIGIELLTNVACGAWARGGRPVPEGLLPALMVLDVLVLTGLLYFTGGPFNPFSFLYLAEIALAAVVLPARWTWTLLGLSVFCSGVLFLHHRELDMGGMAHDELMSIHLRGMWVAFSVAASFIVYFLMRVTLALGRREAELQAARHLAARQEKLASLATLAAGAAHELATPLSTIALVARELERQLQAPGHKEAGPQEAGSAIADVRLIRAEVERCRTVLGQMAAEAGESTGENLGPVSVPELLEAALGGLADRSQVRVELAVDGVPVLRLPLRALSQAIRGLLKNALDASPKGGEIVLVARAEDAHLCIEVRDSGTGMPPEVFAHAGEPFFTTKPPGSGMGLGLFLVRAVVERVGGQVKLSSAPGKGTVARLRLPLGQFG